MTPTPAQITMQDVIAQCRAYRDAAYERRDSGVAREWQLVWLSLNELTGAAGVGMPSKEQIEAVDKIISTCLDTNASNEDIRQATMEIFAALTAAAEVGEPYPQVEFTRTENELRSAILLERERCAQVADEWAETIEDRGMPPILRRLAAAIRAQKDK